MAKNYSRQIWIRTGILALVMLAIAGGVIYWMLNSHSVYIDSSSVKAPLINLSPSAPGILQEVYVHEGDEVNANTPVARVDNELVKSKVAGVIVSVPETIGAQVSAAAPVVTMIDPTQLRVVGEVDENKGLDRIKVGEPVTFTVDAFGSQQFSGVIDEVAPTSNASGVVFNISNSRETQQFDVKARFDTSKYPQLKNGMSARMWVNTN
jgi:multidrug resistance efflux pump